MLASEMSKEITDTMFKKLAKMRTKNKRFLNKRFYDKRSNCTHISSPMLLARETYVYTRGEMFIRIGAA